MLGARGYIAGMTHIVRPKHFRLADSNFQPGSSQLPPTPNLLLTPTFHPRAPVPSSPTKLRDDYMG